MRGGSGRTPVTLYAARPTYYIDVMYNKQPRCAVLLESYHPVVGGMEAQGRTFAQMLKARGAEPVIITRRTSPDLPKQEQVDGVPVYRCGPCGRSSRNRWFFMLTCIPALIHLRRRYDVLLVSGFRVLGIPAVLIGRWFGKKIILKAECMGEMSGAFFFGGLDRLRVKRGSLLLRAFLSLRNRVLKKADGFVSMYSEMTQEFREGGVDAGAICCIPNAVDAEAFAPVDAKARARLCEALGLDAARRYLVYTGRLVSYKGVLRLLRVWKELRVRHADWTLLLIGEGGVDVFNCEEEARRYADEQKMADQTVFTGPVRNVRDWLKVCDLFILPTENDAFPVCILEAMSSGLGIITTPTGALKDVIQDGVTGRIVAAGRDEALQKAMEELLSDAGLRGRLGGAARAEVLAHYTPSAVADRYLALFRERVEEVAARSGGVSVG